MKSTVILLSGKQGSGKSAIQKKLSELLNSREDYLAITINLADILYEMHDAVLSILHKYMKPRDNKFDKTLLQILGTDWARNTIDQMLWVNCLKSKMNVLSLTKKGYQNIFFIVGDVRFENEFDAFPDKDFQHVLKVRLTAPEDIRKARCSMWRENTTHISETALDNYYSANKFDLILDTYDGTITKCVEVIWDNIEYKG